jgi:DNA-binding NarL/FixJ family response regulator
MSRPSLVLADDHLLVLEGLEALLRQHYEIVARVTDGRALIEVVARLRPDVVVSDIAMPEIDGLTATARIRTLSPSTKIVLVTMSDDPAMVNTARRAGASGYVLKTHASTRLVATIDAALAGLPLQDSGTEVVPPRGEHGPPGLTERQLEVLRLLGQGLTMKEIGAALHISKRTVAFHKYRIMELLGLETNADIVRYALSLGQRSG